MNIDKLNKKEKAIFDMIGQGVKASEIAHKLGIAVNTVHTYRFRILRALGLSSTTDIVKAYIWENGRTKFFRYQPDWEDVMTLQSFKFILGIK